MKKLASAILIVIYFAFSAGATVRLHYCMGEYAGFSVNTLKEEACSKCGMNKHKNESNCCNDVVIKAKISDPHSGSCTPPTPEIPTFYCTFQFPALQKVILSATPFVSLGQPHPPGNILSPIYLLHRNFRI